MTYMKSALATGMIIIPLLVAAAVKYWPSGYSEDLSGAKVLVLPAKVAGESGSDYLSDAVAAALSAHLSQVTGLQLKAPPRSLEMFQFAEDYGRVANAYGVDLLILSVITVDSGTFQVNLQVVDPHRQKLIWRNPYHGPRGKYLELMRAAGEGIRLQLRPLSDPVRRLSGVSSISEAELAFHEGRYHHERGDSAAASAAFKKALELDPELGDDIRAIQ
jgi:TolB-like protein